MQKYFNPSKLFAPLIESENKQREKESHNQRNRRKKKQVQVKIGHGGTLDPLATGVLIAGVGKGTKSLQDFLLCTKEYEAVILFGTSTDTYDRVGKVLKRAPYEHLTKEMVEKALEPFRGKFMQLPPLFSALKMNGKPLYEYAREGKEIPREIERRQVDVLNLELVEWMEGGTHTHVAPTEEAGAAEVKVASQLWKQENALPGGGMPAVAPEVKVESSSTPVKAEEESEDLNKSAEVTVEPIASTATTTSVETKTESDILLATTEEVTQPPKEEEKAAVSTEEAVVKEEDPAANLNNAKRKLSEEQDDLVHEKPVSKRAKQEPNSADAIMSGGLADPDTTVPSESNIPATNTSAKGPPAARIRMTVTSGFYVRSLCHDLGAALGSAALMAELERTRQGDFKVGELLTFEDMEKGEEVWGPKVEAMIDAWNEKGRVAPAKE